MKNNKCHCYINSKTYAKNASKGGTMKDYKPCPIHDEEAKVQDWERELLGDDFGILEGMNFGDK